MMSSYRKGQAVSERMPKFKLPLTKNDAELLMKRYLATIDPVEPDNPWVINYAHSKEFEWGWLFQWHNKKFLETNDFDYEVGGNSPVIVTKADGVLYSTGTAKSGEYYVDLFLKDRSMFPKIAIPE